MGDGVALAAGPLLLASLTSDPAPVAGAMFVQQLPWLLFALPAGVYVDRLDRRRLIVLVNLVRPAPDRRRQPNPRRLTWPRHFLLRHPDAAGRRTSPM